MICFDCATHGEASSAVAVCVGCGAGLCLEHAHVNPRWLTRTMAIDRTVSVEPPARVVRCGLCTHAEEAAAHPAASANERRAKARP
jgi:hypothetical protein